MAYPLSTQYELHATVPFSYQKFKYLNCCKTWFRILYSKDPFFWLIELLINRLFHIKSNNCVIFKNRKTGKTMSNKKWWTNKCLFTLQLIVYTEAAVQRCSVNKVFLKISQDSQENTCARHHFYRAPLMAASGFSYFYQCCEFF